MAEKSGDGVGGSDNGASNGSSNYGYDLDGGSGDGIGKLDPANLSAGAGSSGGDSAGGSGKRRGRKPGSTNKKKAPEDLGIITGTLSFLHLMAATVTKIPELNLSDEEAAQLAKASTDLMEQYDIPINPKRMAQLQLVSCLAMIYGTRIMAYGNRKKEEGNPTTINPATAQQPQNGDTVVQFSTPGFKG